jgi:hypothetical protein
MTTPLETRVAGVFVFWPLLAQLGFDDLVKQASYPGSRMVPATSALLSLLALKLVDKERSCPKPIAILLTPFYPEVCVR